MKMTYNKKIIDNLTELFTKRLKLRMFTVDDVKDVYEYASDEIVVKYVTWPIHENIKNTEDILKEYFINKPGKYAIELMELKKCIGCIDLNIDIENDKSIFGYVLNRKFWNKGIMTEALEEIIRINFEELCLNRIEAMHFVGNEASGRVMSKCGMKNEGMRKKELFIKGKYWDIVHYGLIKEEWEET